MSELCLSCLQLCQTGSASVAAAFPTLCFWLLPHPVAEGFTAEQCLMKARTSSSLFWTYSQHDFTVSV